MYKLTEILGYTSSRNTANVNYMPRNDADNCQATYKKRVRELEQYMKTKNPNPDTIEKYKKIIDELSKYASEKIK